MQKYWKLCIYPVYKASLDDLGRGFSGFLNKNYLIYILIYFIYIFLGFIIIPLQEIEL